MEYNGKYQVRTKIVVEDHKLKQLRPFNYLELYYFQDDICGHKLKLQRYQKMCGSIARTMKTTRREIKIKFYKVMTIRTLLNGYER